MDENYFDSFESTQDVQLYKSKPPVLQKIEKFYPLSTQTYYYIVEDSTCSMANQNITRLENEFYNKRNENKIRELISNFIWIKYRYRNVDMLWAGELINEMDKTYSEYIETNKMTDGYCNTLEITEIEEHITSINLKVARYLFDKEDARIISHLTTIKQQLDTKQRCGPDPPVDTKKETSRTEQSGIPPRSLFTA